MRTWFDLHVYLHAGDIVRQNQAALYSWQLKSGVKFVYTPFAAMIFAIATELPTLVLNIVMMVISLGAVYATIWLTLSALGWRRQGRLVAVLGLTAAVLWTEPVLEGLRLGQVELILMASIVWDLSRSDDRKHKGAAIGVAAGIKLVPIIFVFYLVLCGRIRQAVTAGAAFACTVLIGFVVLPHASSTWWLTGYFVHAGTVGGIGDLLNQSLRALSTRATGSINAGTPVWLVTAAAVGSAGLTSAAALHRSGRPVAGWALCGITGVLISPISWEHHWVWVLPVLGILVDLTRGADGSIRWWYLLAFGATFGIFGGWPAHWTGHGALIPRGLLGFFVGPHAVDASHHLHGIEVISWNLYVIAGLSMVGAGVLGAVRARSVQQPNAYRSQSPGGSASGLVRDAEA